MSERINPYDVAGVRKAVVARRRTYSSEISAAIEAKLAALAAERDALKAELTRVRDLAEKDRAAFADTLCAYRTALRETREALVSIAFDACSYICPSTWKIGMPVPHSTRCLTVQAVLARHAGLVEEVDRG